MYPPATLEAASGRISMIYKNAIFDRTEEGYGEMLNNEEEQDEARGNVTTEAGDSSRAVKGHGSISFLRGGSQDDSLGSMAPPPIPNRPANATAISDSGVFESQETQSFNYSDASSIARFPTFHFNIHALASLAQVSKMPSKGRKNGKDAGKRVGVLRLVLADQEGCVGKLTAWREVAEEWGGIGQGMGCKRGDVVHLENVAVDSSDPSTSPNFTASPMLKSKMTICYRTMPHAHEDGVFRPDLRLGESDPCVRKVATVVRWFEEMAGLPGDSH
ncbi:hypothetical protein FA13DRAFT_1731632 [Coprinellus micaceus]|uniref:OB domain-containing protein n=1 Tax=Coprinellus micaceus TaxID=71717 RepID=A0A4Y7TFV6_COPMI|nr:hypothetical protein FA13DRAFT_1731632 [Coprinellus micaceus]